MGRLDLVDKARAWDAIAQKNAEIARLREALKIISQDSYLDEFQMEYRPTSAALTARAALAE